MEVSDLLFLSKRLNLQVVLFCLGFLFIVSACQKAPLTSTEVVPTVVDAPISLATSTPVANPTRDISDTGAGAANPYPDTNWGLAYPQPEQIGGDLPYPIPLGAYPLPQVYPPPSQGYPYNPYPSPNDTGFGSTYPGPGSEITPQPYPNPQATPQVLPTATLPLPTPSSTPFPTNIPLSLRMVATDPLAVDLATGKLQFIEFFAYWDGYSQSMAQVVHELEAEYGNDIIFIYLDIDDPATKELKIQLGYETYPQFVLVDGNGQIVYEWRGLVKIEKFEDVFNAFVN
jgi:thiol-disulfide isomerase/thioredoxin